MLQSFEIQFFQLLVAYLHWPALVSLLTAGPLCAIFFLKQIQERDKTTVPGLIAGLFGAIAITHTFWTERALRGLENIISILTTPHYSRGAVPLFEPIFSQMVGPLEQRYLVEECIFVGIVVYLASVIYHMINGTLETSGLKAKSHSSFLGGRKTDRPERSKGNELGSGDLATKDHISRWMSPSKDGMDTVLPVSDIKGAEGTIFKEGQLHIPNGHRNRHILTVAKTGSGKTTRLILPILYNDCMCKHRSTVVIDSKPEMWGKLAAMTRKYNPEKEILRFNPLDTAHSLSWNILSKIEDDTDCKLIANTIIMATDVPGAKSDSPFFRNNALAILNAVMVGLLHDPEMELSMPAIHGLIQSGMKNLCSWLEARPEAARTTRTFIELARSGSQNADTIMSELSMRIAAWDISSIRATTATNEIDIQTLIDKPTIFVVEFRESEMEMLRPMANVIVIELLRFLTKSAESYPGAKLPRPVSFVIDEFASALGRLPDIHVKLNTLRSRNVSIVAAIQSMGQIKANYADQAESVTAGFNTKIFMPTLDLTDGEWASKESGQMTIRFKTQTKGYNKKIIEVFRSNNDSVQEQVQQRPVLTADEVMRPSDNVSTFFLPETPVFQGNLVPFFKVPLLRKRIEEFDKGPEYELQLRDTPIEFDDKIVNVGGAAATPAAATPGGPPPGITNTKSWDEEKIWDLLEKTKEKLDWQNTTGSARKWWLAFERENKHRPALILRLAEELANRKATITEFFLAYVYSNTDNIQANLYYLDYTRLKKEEERKKREEKARKAKETASDTESSATSGTSQAA